MAGTRHIGVWLDFRKAVIVSLKNEESKVIEIHSDMDEYNPKGGYGGAKPYGPQDSISESSYVDKRKQQAKKYFQSIIAELEKADDFIILGPAEARIGLEKVIRNTSRLDQKLLDNSSADSMTTNQLVAKVKDYYSQK